MNQLGAAPASANTSVFRQIFIARVHQVLESGYRRLKAESYAKEEEPAITGELRKAMNDILRDMSAPAWADYFSVHDDPPVDDGKRKGKRRNRIDIRVDSSIPRPGASFSFEAKRLARGYTVAKYLGEEGLGSFLSGEYAQDENEAGMIGYVQDDDATYWSEEIFGTIKKYPAQFGVTGNKWWSKHSFYDGPENLFLSVHNRVTLDSRIRLFHSLLLFCKKKETK